MFAVGILSLLLVLSLPAAATGEAGPAAERPRICLALSGGGARGGAHVGVIRVLEQHRIPIDCIAGTSFGAIVGGLYASGMSVDEIEATLKETDWPDMFQDAIAREDRSFRRKKDDELFLVKSKPGFSDGQLKLPAGVIQGQKVDLLLSRLTLPVAAIDDFDRLPIPFRAVASDIVTGEAVVLGKGSLARAIRASMSIPAVFAPVEIDGRLLVDGGVANNLPIDVVRDMGAVIVIAVDIGTPLARRDQLKTVLSIANQLSGFLTRRNTEAQIATLRDQDILIVPDLGDIETADFERVTEAVETGRVAAEASLGRLQALAVPEPVWHEYRAAVGRPADRAPVVDFIRVDNHSPISTGVILSALHARTGERLDVDRLEHDISQIYGLELFQNIRYDLAQTGDETGLLLQVEQKAWGPKYLQFGLAFSDDFDGNNFFTLSASYLSTAVNSLGGEWRGLVTLGEEPVLGVDFYQPLDVHGRWFVHPEIRYARTNVFVDADGFRALRLRNSDTAASLSVGRNLGYWGEIRLGLRRSFGSTRVDERFTDIEKRDYDDGQWRVKLSVDKLNSFYFPTRGGKASLEWIGAREELGGDLNYDQVLFEGLMARSWGPNTLLAAGRFQGTVGSTAPVHARFRAGGPFELSGFTINSLSGQQYVLMETVGFRRVGGISFLPLYAGFSLEYGNVFEDMSDVSLKDMLLAGSLWLGADSPLGPLYVGYGHAEGGRGSAHVFLGRLF